MIFENRGDRPVQFADTSTSVFIGPSGQRMLLAAEGHCGYASDSKGARIEAGVCLLIEDAFVVEPHASVSRIVTLFKGLPGMKPLTPGTYVFDNLIRFRVGHHIPDVGAGRSVVLRLVYDIERTPARPTGRPE